MAFNTKETMSITCEIAVNLNATPDELRAVGTALWRWRCRGAGDSDLYQLLDSQGQADLLAGRLPLLNRTPSVAGRWSVRFRIRDDIFESPRSVLDSLRQEIPKGGVDDVFVDGESWQTSSREVALSSAGD